MFEVGGGGGFRASQPDSAQERVQRSMDVPAVTAAPPRLSPGIRYCPEMIERRCIDKSAPRQGFFPTCVLLSPRSKDLAQSQRSGFATTLIGRWIRGARTRAEHTMPGGHGDLGMHKSD